MASKQAALLVAPVRIFKVTSREKSEIGRHPQLVIQSYAQFGYQMLLQDQEHGNILTIDLSNVLDLHFKSSTCQVSFYFKTQDQTFSIVLVFQNSDEMLRFMHLYTRCCFEINAKKRATSNDIPEIDRYMAYANLDAAPGPKYSDEPTFPSPDLTTKSGVGDGGCNTLLRFGVSTDNTMVVRQYDDRCDLGLFTGDRTCQFRMKLPTLSDRTNNPIMVGDMLTAPGDRSLLMIDPNQRTEVFRLDLDRGMVTNQFQTVDSQNSILPVDSLIPLNGRHDHSNEVFVGYNERNTMLIDPRLRQSVANHSTYATVNNFTCGMTTRSGHLAMGSRDGVVRLYKAPALTRATVNFQTNIGTDPVLSVDVTPDEQWVLATCKYYLAVFNVLAPSTGKLAYVAPMKSEKPPLMRLSLRPQDMQKIAERFGNEIQPFSNGKFVIKGNRVQSIVAGIGSAIVSWDFRAIENNNAPRYTITLIGGERIVDDHVLDRSDDILFISPNMVSVAERSHK